MNLPLFIARRYFLSKRKRSFINLISILSMVGVAFSTAALIIVLSVFNGFEELLRSLNQSFDPEIKISLARGKSFERDTLLLHQIKSVEGVQVITEVIEDYAYLRYRDAEMVVIVKGVGDNFLDQHRLDKYIVEGKLRLHENGVNYAIVGRGVQYVLSMGVTNNIYPLQLFYVNHTNSATLDPSKLYTQRNIDPGAVFSIEKNFDENYIFVPLNFFKELLQYDHKRTSLEIKTKEEADIETVQKKLKELLGEKFLVLTNDEQHKSLYKLLRMEKLFVLISLAILILVSSINIFFSLMMLTIDKKKDITILSALGTSPKMLKNIFLSEGALIAFAGAGIGLLLGGVICWLQDQFGLIGMGMENALVANYPVKLKAIDFLTASFVIVIITFLISFYPARLASKSFSTKEL